MLLHLESSLGVVLRLVLLGPWLWGLVISFTVTSLLLGQLCQTLYCDWQRVSSSFQEYYVASGPQLFHLSFKASPGDFRSCSATTQVGHLPMVTWFCVCSARAFLVTDIVTCSESPPHQFVPWISGLWNEKPSQGHSGGTEMAVFSLKGQK